jgi:hypothetical protein
VGAPRGTPAERFQRHVRRSPTSDCIEWTGSRTKGGYGRFQFKSGTSPRPAHRVAWFLHYGRWPGADLDHSCCNPSCVNVDHLTEVTVAKNNELTRVRGRHGNSIKTHCPQGHAYAEHGRVCRSNTGGDQRICKICVRDRSRRRRARAREGAPS